MKKYYTLAEYCRRFSVDSSTHKKMCKLSLIQSRSTGENGLCRRAKMPLEFWRELHTKAENTSSIPAMFYSVPGYIRKIPAMHEVDPRAFYYFMKEHYRAFKTKRRNGYAFDGLVFFFSDLQAGATQFLNKAEGNAPQKRKETPSAPDPVNTCSISGNTTQGSIYVSVPEKGPGMSLLDWLLVLLLVGDVVAVACVACCL